MTDHRRWPGLLIVVLTALAALLPAILNGGPFFHPDTPSYLRAAAAGLFKVFGIHSEWTKEYLQVYSASPVAPAAMSGPIAPPPEPPVTLNGRSIYYGMFAYILSAPGRFWLLIILQSVLAAVSVYMTIGLIGRATGTKIAPRYLLAIGLVTALASSLGFNSSYVMPGVFSGLGLLAEVNLLFLWHWQSRWEKAFWAVLMAYAMLVHTTNMILASAMLVFGLGYLLWRRVSLNAWQLAGIAGSILVGVLGQAVFAYAVTESTGAAPIRPPFLAMRLIADGSGYAHLREHCVTEHYFYCRTLSHPNAQSDVLLWSDDPQTALFRGLSEREQRQSAAEQGRFVSAVIGDRPVQVLGEIARNSVKQLLSLDLSEFNYTLGNRERFEETMPPDLLHSMKNTRAYRRDMPVGAFEFTNQLLAALSLIILIVFLLRKEPASSRVATLRGYCLCILCAIVTNAVICGALSGPKGRYEMRLIWVLPVVAGSLACSRQIRISVAPSVT